MSVECLAHGALSVLTSPSPCFQPRFWKRFNQKEKKKKNPYKVTTCSGEHLYLVMLFAVLWLWNHCSNRHCQLCYQCTFWIKASLAFFFFFPQSFCLFPYTSENGELGRKRNNWMFHHVIHLFWSMWVNVNVVVTVRLLHYLWIWYYSGTNYPLLAQRIYNCFSVIESLALDSDLTGSIFSKTERIQKRLTWIRIQDFPSARSCLVVCSWRAIVLQRK